MWVVVGIDDDSVEHVWAICQDECSAKEKRDSIASGYVDFRAPYIDALAKAEKEEQKINKAVKLGLIKESKEPPYTDYMGWKDQGFYVKEFVIREVQDENL